MPNILVVDDTPANLHSMKVLLQSLNVNVITADSGNEALSLILRHEFALILLDVKMPVMDGYETAELILQVEESKHIPIIFVTGNEKSERAFKGYEAGAVDYLMKPIDSYILISKVKVFLKLYEQNKEMGTLLENKNTLLTEIEGKNTKLKKYSKLWKGVSTIIIFISLTLMYTLHLVSKKNIQLVAYADELNIINAYTITLNQAYKKFIPFEFIKLLNKDSIIDVHLGDQILREMTVMFADIRGYTSLSENLTPDENIQLLNDIFAVIQPTIKKYHGIINKYLGDGVMVLFTSGADDAVLAGIEMLKKLEEFSNLQVEKGRPPIQMGIGIDQGLLMLGTVGKEERMEQTVVADSVNLASRIEGMSKMYGANLLMSENIYSHLEDTSNYQVRLMDLVRAKGRKKPIEVYQVIDGEREEVCELYKQTTDYFSKGVSVFRDKNFKEAIICFEQVLQINENDVAAQIYMNRCEELIAKTLPEDWSPVRELTFK
ncbi:MAG: Adenylate cyclase 1 [Chlamydiae bacterium]|nr:Adenylate cyclase 1 [Chlamydiota bacterium]